MKLKPESYLVGIHHEFDMELQNDWPHVESSLFHIGKLVSNNPSKRNQISMEVKDSLVSITCSCHSPHKKKEFLQRLLLLVKEDFAIKDFLLGTFQKQLGFVHLILNNVRSSIKALQEALKLLNIFGREHFIVGEILQVLRIVYGKLGILTEQIKFLSKALAFSEKS